MSITIKATTPSASKTQVAALEQRLAQTRQQLVKDEKSGATLAHLTTVKLEVAQVAAIETEIAQVSASGTTAGTSALGNGIDVTA